MTLTIAIANRLRSITRYLNANATAEFKNVELQKATRGTDAGSRAGDRFRFRVSARAQFRSECRNWREKRNCRVCRNTRQSDYASWTKKRIDLKSSIVLLIKCYCKRGKKKVAFQLLFFFFFGATARVPESSVQRLEIASFAGRTARHSRKRENYYYYYF